MVMRDQLGALLEIYSENVARFEVAERGSLLL